MRIRVAPNYYGLQISTKHWMPKLLLLPDDRAAEPLAIGDEDMWRRESRCGNCRRGHCNSSCRTSL